MNVIDIKPYIIQREKLLLENKIASLVNEPIPGGIIMIKYYFEEWMQKFHK